MRRSTALIVIMTMLLPRIAMASPPSYFVTLLLDTRLPSEAQCADWVRSSPTAETIPENARPNHVVPTASQLARLRVEGFTFGPADNLAQFARVTGNFTGSTDMILRWGACKYGIDENIVRAQAWQESWWRQPTHGDKRTDLHECVQTEAHPHQPLTPPFDALLNFDCTNCCWQSWSIMQTKIYYAWMTWPMIKDSTAFAVDYRLADQRSCMNGYYHSFFEGRGTYSEDIDGRNLDRILWGCIGMHYSGDWYDRDAHEYITDVRGDLDHRRWLTPWIHKTGP
jgi:hypothetical protein